MQLFGVLIFKKCIFLDIEILKSAYFPIGKIYYNGSILPFGLAFHES